MLRQTEVALGLGEVVVLDASWTDERWRAGPVRSRTGRRADIVELRCTVAPEIANRRIRRRMAAGGDPSDATPDIAAQMSLAQDTWSQAATIDTSAGPGESLVKALAAHRGRASALRTRGIVTVGCGSRALRPWPTGCTGARDRHMATPTADHLVPRVGDLGLRPPVVVARDTPIAQATRIMRANEISALVVGSPGELVSIVTERDLTQAVADAVSLDTEVGAIASTDLMTVTPDTTVMDVATTMLREGVRHLVVVRAGRAVGVVSIRDALAALVGAVTPDTVFVMLEQLRVDPPELWLG